MAYRPGNRAPGPLRSHHRYRRGGRLPCRSGSAGRRSERKGAAGSPVVRRALSHEIAARKVQPIEHFDPFVLFQSSQRRNPRLEHLDMAKRTVSPSLSRRLHARSPGRLDAADKHQAGIGRRRHDRHRDLGFPYLVFAIDLPDMPLLGRHGCGSQFKEAAAWRYGRPRPSPRAWPTPHLR
jgi:hypothetical protein